MTTSVLVLDCGATNVKACIIEPSGSVIASHSILNETIPDPYYPGGLIWDINDIWDKLSTCSRKVCSMASDSKISAVTVTTFGVDGAAMKKDGTFCYPVISWQCARTQPVEQSIKRYFDPDDLYRITGLQSYHFNTIHKLIWLHENRPDVLENIDFYVLMPSIILYRLSGVFVTDTTMAGTTMLTDISRRSFSKKILEQLEIRTESFPPLVEPGSIVGKITPEAAEKMGIPAGLPVVAAGHDTQFAILASGAGVNQPVLSSGTWDILMVRANAGSLTLPSKDSGLTVEFDALPGLINPGVQWVASGVLEWTIKMFYADLLKDKERYGTLISEAEAVIPGCHGLMMIPELFPGSFSGKPGMFNGFTHETSRGHFYRAALEALSFYLARGLDKLQKACNYKAEEMICVGGGSKNKLWNQIRSDVLGIPLKALDMKETTALGAAMFAFTGIGYFNNLEQAIEAVENHYEIFEPGKNHEQYQTVYSKFAEIAFNVFP